LPRWTTPVDVLVRLQPAVLTRSPTRSWTTI